MNLRRAQILIIVALAALNTLSQAIGAPTPTPIPTLATVKTKYGRWATPLSVDHAYFNSHAAPDFWALSPFYAAQRDDRSCSLASLTMVANAIRKSQKLGSETELYTQDTLLEASRSKMWKTNLSNNGKGVTLAELKTLAETIVALTGAKIESVLIFQPDVASPQTLEALRKILRENEKSDTDLIVLNFLQSTLTDDAAVGHIAPIGAYDEKTKRVLVFDPDRRWYEPYWAPDTKVLDAMTTLDPVSEHLRGLIWIRFTRP